VAGDVTSEDLAPGGDVGMWRGRQLRWMWMVPQGSPWLVGVGRWEMGQCSV
jgi:hypothetical protein